MTTTPNTRHVLVVDDYADLAELMGDLLVDACTLPIEVELAYNGAEAVEHVLAGRPDVALLDINMPVMGGVEAAMNIRRRLGDDAPLLIGMTGNLGNMTSPEVRQAFDRVLAKPVDMEVLVGLVCA